MSRRPVPGLRAGREFVARRLLVPAQQFIHTEVSGGVVLLAAALAALVWVNSPWKDSYEDLWSTIITVDAGLFVISEDLQHWVNDGLMALFFFVVGLEIKRELVRGELSSVRRATLPVVAAIGGMAVPALIYTAFNAGGEGEKGWGIPMATDIAFALGVLALLGDRIPFGARTFLLALAIVDDLGAILVIAVFYTEDLAMEPLAWAAVTLVVAFALSRAGVRNMYVYVLFGVLLWAAALKSGVHATIAGVLLAALTPANAYYDRAGFLESARTLLDRFRDAFDRADADGQQAALGEIEELARESEAPLDRLERALHPWTSYVVVPIFALANAGVELSSDAISNASSSQITHGIVLGLVIGKVVGIFGFSWLALRTGLCHLPAATAHRHIAGAALLGGIGFTVSLFIADLAFDSPELVEEAKIGILAASVIAGVAGFTFLRVVSHRPAVPEPPP